MKKSSKMSAADAAFAELAHVPPEYFEEMSRSVPGADIGALRVFLALRNAARRIDNAVAGWLIQNDLTSTKLDVLHLLHATGGLRIMQISESLQMTQPNVTFVVNSLEREGFVGREAQGRTTVVRLTRKGEHLMDSVTPGHMEAIKRALEGLGPVERERLLVALARMTRGFESVTFESGRPKT